MNIADVLPASFDMDGHCDSKNYLLFEARVIAYLLGMGWTLKKRFISTDADSFGPLVRVGHFLNTAGEPVELVHG